MEQDKSPTYPKMSQTPDHNHPDPNCVAYHVNRIATQWAALLRENLAALYAGSDIPDTLCDKAPRRRRAEPQRALAIEIAQLLYPAPTDSTISPVIKYEKDIVLLRKAIAHRNEARDLARKVTWRQRILEQGPWDKVNDPWSEAVLAQPMPVSISDSESLTQTFQHLSLGGGLTPTFDAHVSTSNEPYYGVEQLEFEKGIVYKDGRLDLCKQ